MKRQVGRIIGDDAAGVEEHDVGAGVLDGGDIGGDVHLRVDFAQVGLEQALGLEPPGWFGGGGECA